MNIDETFFSGTYGYDEHVNLMKDKYNYKDFFSSIFTFFNMRNEVERD